MAALTNVETHNALEEIGISTVVFPLQPIDLAAQVPLQLLAVFGSLIEPGEKMRNGGCRQAMQLVVRHDVLDCLAEVHI